MTRGALACAALCIGGAPLHAQQPVEDVTMAVPAVGLLLSLAAKLINRQIR